MQGRISQPGVSSSRRNARNQRQTQAAASSDRSESESDSGSSSGVENENEDFSDWASSLHGALRTLSLFSIHDPSSSEAPGKGKRVGDATQAEEVWLDTPMEAVEYDAQTFGWDLRQVVSKLNLDDYQRIKLVNWIRKHKPSPASPELAEITSNPNHPLFTSHMTAHYSPVDGQENWNSYLRPTMEGDGLLQLSFEDDSWSSDGEDVAAAATAEGASAKVLKESGNDEVARLRLELSRAQDQIKHLQTLVQETLEAAETTDEDSSSGDDADKVISLGSKRKQKVKGSGKKQDVDTYYFDSYAANDIHELMLKDTTRTVGYGRFMLSNAKVFQDATVMDVGCGTGILSMFAAKAGAKHVYAIEASGLANKARENIRRNGLENKITVIQGKVEDVQLPVEKVDIIVSEWMGYMLLYEAMFDSVLRARDRYLRSGGLMAPSQTRIVLSAISAQRIYDEAFEFWDELYGFDMKAMRPAKFEEGIIEIVDEGELLTTEAIIKDLNAHTIQVLDLDFSSTFTLLPASNASSDAGTPIRAFIAWFDTFFASTSEEVGQAGPNDVVSTEFIPDDALMRPVVAQAPSALSDDATGGERHSFTTGPHGKPTHWKQIVFMLKEEVVLKQDECLTGTFHLRKSTENPRELAIEIHWTVQQSHNAAGGEKSNDKGKIRYDVFKVV